MVIRCNVAADDQVVDGSVLNSIERRAIISCGRHVDIDGMAVSFEGAFEELAIHAGLVGLGSDADIGTQMHGLAAVVVAAVYRSTKSRPVIIVVDLSDVVAGGRKVRERGFGKEDLGVIGGII